MSLVAQRHVAQHHAIPMYDSIESHKDGPYTMLATESPEVMQWEGHHVYFQRIETAR